MARTEFAFEGRRVRHESEALSARVALERRRVEELEVEAERMLQRVAELERQYDTLLEEARHLFECTLVNEFLCWPHADDVKAALCVPLVDDLNQLNIQVTALQVYRLERGRGLEFFEPVGDSETTQRESAGQDDPRLEAFFTEGRPHAADARP